ncbi:MAG: MFS transporter [Eubacterium sp.]
MKKINNKIKNFFGFGDAGFSFMTTVETSFFLIFLTDVAQLPLGTAAIISTLTGIADTISAIVAGAIVDKCNLKHGKYRSWLLYGPPFVIAFFAMQFTKVGTNLTAAIVICLGFIISHFIWNIAWTANRSLVGALTDEPTERAHLSGRISAGSSVGKLFASKLVPMLAIAFAGLFGGGGAVWGYTCTALVGAALMLVGYYVHYFITAGYDLPEPKADKGTELATVEKVSVLDMLKGVFQNPPLVATVFYDFIRLIGYYAFMAFVAYFVKVMFPESAASVTGNVLLAFNIGTLLGSLLAKYAVAKFGTKMSSLVGVAGCAVFMFIAFFFTTSQIAIILLIFVSQVFFGVSFGLTTSLYTNCATYSEYKTGKNTKGFIMGLCSFSIKMSIVLRGIVITTGLGIIGYSAKAAITDSLISGVSIMCFVIPTIFMAVSLLPLLFYKLSDKEVMEMDIEIAARKKAAIEKAKMDDTSVNA